MIDRQEMAVRHSRHLAELAELGMAVARDLGASTLQAEAHAKAELGLAFQRAARSVRQTLALEARLARDVARAEQDARKEAERVLQDKVARRKAKISAAVEREVWAEYEDDDARTKLDAFDDLLTEVALSDDFLDLEIEAQIARIRQALGLPARAAEPPAAFHDSA